MNEMKEIREAIQAGENALSCLYAAERSLNSAKSWGIFDMFGGGMLSTMIKRSRMSDAKNSIEQAKLSLYRFRKELQDVNVSLNLNMDIGGFLSFADFFFDGFIFDYMVQSKINNAKEQVSDAIVNVSNILTALKTKV